MNRIKLFFVRLCKTLFMHKPCNPLSREVCEALKKKDNTLYLIYEIARQNMWAR